MSLTYTDHDLDPLLIRLALNFTDSDRLPILMVRMAAAHERGDYAERQQMILETCHLLGITREYTACVHKVDA